MISVQTETEKLTKWLIDLAGRERLAVVYVWQLRRASEFPSLPGRAEADDHDPGELLQSLLIFKSEVHPEATGTEWATKLSDKIVAAARHDCDAMLREQSFRVIAGPGRAVEIGPFRPGM